MIGQMKFGMNSLIFFYSLIVILQSVLCNVHQCSINMTDWDDPSTACSLQGKEGHGRAIPG